MEKLTKRDIAIFDTDMLNALSDETRQDLILLVAEKREIRAGDIANYFHLSRPSISHHLQILKRAKILKARKDGKEHYYSLNADYMFEAIEKLYTVFREYKQTT